MYIYIYRRNVQKEKKNFFLPFSLTEERIDSSSSIEKSSLFCPLLFFSFFDIFNRSGRKLSLRLVRVHLGLVLLFRVWLALVSSVRGGVKEGKRDRKRQGKLGLRAQFLSVLFFIYFFELVKIKKKKRKVMLDRLE